MFKRRTPLTIIKNIKEFIWPSMGWRRMGRYVKLRVLRLPDSSAKIAAGLTNGITISFTPAVGTHILQAIGISYFMRANIISSVIGTVVGNPWTFPFMWGASIYFGSFLFGLFGLPASTALPDEMSLKIFWELVKNEPLRVLLPWLVGGYLLALLLWFPLYFILFKLIKAAKNARRRARMRKVKKVAKEITGQE